MSSIARFSALNTKCKALEKHLIRKDSYDKLLTFDSNDEIISYIANNTVFGENIKKLSYKDSERLTVERVLRLFVFKEYQKLGHYMVDEYKELFRVLMMRFEVENVKGVLRAVYRNEPEYEVMHNLLLSDYFKQLDYESLIKCQTMEETVNTLKGSIYYKPLVHYLNEDPDEMLFFMELALDKLYFNKLIEQAQKLEKIDRDLMKLFVGKNIDIQNIQLLYRLYKTFHISSERKFNYVKSGGNELGLNVLKKLAYAGSLEDFIGQIRKTSYGFLFDEGIDYEVFMEIRAERYMYEFYKDQYKKNRFSIAVVMKYIHLVEYSIKDLNTMIEAKKYNYTAEEIYDYLVIPYTEKKVI